MKFGFFDKLDLLCRFGRFKDDFLRFLGTGIFLDTVCGHRMINFCWKLCTGIYNFLFWCFVHFWDCNFRLLFSSGGTACVFPLDPVFFQFI